jgi:hypothetical protein
LTNKVYGTNITGLLAGTNIVLTTNGTAITINSTATNGVNGAQGPAGASGLVGTVYTIVSSDVDATTSVITNRHGYNRIRIPNGFSFSLGKLGGIQAGVEGEILYLINDWGSDIQSINTGATGIYHTSGAVFDNQKVYILMYCKPNGTDDQWIPTR